MSDCLLIPERRGETPGDGESMAGQRPVEDDPHG
jgi:hypothetical protein